MSAACPLPSEVHAEATTATAPEPFLASEPSPESAAPQLSAEQIVTLLRDQRELIGRILQAPASSVAPHPINSGEIHTTPHQQASIALTSAASWPAAQINGPKATADEERPPMIIERAMASQGMQLIGDLSSEQDRSRLNWPGFVIGLMAAAGTGVALYVILAKAN